MQRPDWGLIHGFETLMPVSSDTPPLTKATFLNPLKKRHQFGVKYSNFEAYGKYAHPKYCKALTILTIHQNKLIAEGFTIPWEQDIKKSSSK